MSVRRMPVCTRPMPPGACGNIAASEPHRPTAALALRLMTRTISRATTGSGATTMGWTCASVRTARSSKKVEPSPRTVASSTRTTRVLPENCAFAAVTSRIALSLCIRFFPRIDELHRAVQTFAEPEFGAVGGRGQNRGQTAPFVDVERAEDVVDAFVFGAADADAQPRKALADGGDDRAKPVM